MNAFPSGCTDNSALVFEYTTDYLLLAAKIDHDCAASRRVSSHRAIPAAMQRITHTVRYRSKKPRPVGPPGCADSGLTPHPGFRAVSVTLTMKSPRFVPSGSICRSPW